jgi:hypothetical protein
VEKSRDTPGHLLSEFGSAPPRPIAPRFPPSRARNLRAAQLLLGQNKLESRVRYLWIEIDDALEIAEKTEVYAHTAGS